MAKDKKRHYVNNKEMLEELIEYKKTNVISPELGKMLLAIANNYSNKGSFINYTWREDMVADAVLTCVKYIHNFNPDKSKNPFAYFTTVCRNAFLNFIKKQKKHSVIKDVCYRNSYVLQERDKGFFLTLKGIDYEIFKEEEN